MGSIKSFISSCSYLGKLVYVSTSTHAGFEWVHRTDTAIPEQSGIYLLVSENEINIQKVGKAEGVKGLKQRFSSYTTKKNKREKLEKDKTDALWHSIMTGQLINQPLRVYIYPTSPVPVNIDIGKTTYTLKSQWARGLEKTLSQIARKENHDLLLSGNLD